MRGKAQLSWWRGTLVLLTSVVLVACGASGDVANDVVTAESSDSTVAKASGGPITDGENEESESDTIPPSAGDDPIVVGTVVPLSGQPAGTAATYLNGIRAFLAHTNATGGVNGRTIDHIIQDDAFEIPRTIAETRRLAEQGEVVAFLGSYGSGATAALAPVIGEVAVPLIGPLAYADSLYDPVQPYVFPLWPGYETLFNIQTEFVFNELGAQTLAVLARAEDAGDEAIQGVEAAVAETGMEIVEVARYERDTTSFTPVLQRLIAAGPDGLVIYASATDLGIILSDLDRLGWEGVVADTVSAGDQQVVTLAEGAAEGVYGHVLVDITGSAPGWDEFIQHVEEYTDAEDPRHAFTASGYVAAQVLVGALESIEHEVTADAVREALEGQVFQTLAGPVEFSADNHLGLNQLQLTQVIDGRVTAIGDPLQLERDLTR